MNTSIPHPRPYTLGGGPDTKRRRKSALSTAVFYPPPPPLPELSPSWFAQPPLNSPTLSSAYLGTPVTCIDIPCTAITTYLPTPSVFFSATYTMSAGHPFAPLISAADGDHPAAAPVTQGAPLPNVDVAEADQASPASSRKRASSEHSDGSSTSTWSGYSDAVITPAYRGVRSTASILTLKAADPQVNPCANHLCSMPHDGVIPCSGATNTNALGLLFTPQEEDEIESLLEFKTKKGRVREAKANGVAATAAKGKGKVKDVVMDMVMDLDNDKGKDEEGDQASAIKPAALASDPESKGAMSGPPTQMEWLQKLLLGSDPAKGYYTAEQYALLKDPEFFRFPDNRGRDKFGNPISTATPHMCYDSSATQTYEPNVPIPTRGPDLKTAMEMVMHQVFKKITLLQAMGDVCDADAKSKSESKSRSKSKSRVRALETDSHTVAGASGSSTSHISNLYNTVNGFDFFTGRLAAQSPRPPDAQMPDTPRPRMLALGPHVYDSAIYSPAPRRAITGQVPLNLAAYSENARHLTQADADHGVADAEAANASDDDGDGEGPQDNRVGVTAPERSQSAMSTLSNRTQGLFQTGSDDGSDEDTAAGSDDHAEYDDQQEYNEVYAPDRSQSAMSTYSDSVRNLFQRASDSDSGSDDDSGSDNEDSAHRDDVAQGLARQGPRTLATQAERDAVRIFASARVEATPDAPISGLFVANSTNIPLPEASTSAGKSDTHTVFAGNSNPLTPHTTSDSDTFGIGTSNSNSAGRSRQTTALPTPPWDFDAVAVAEELRVAATEGLEFFPIEELTPAHDLTELYEIRSGPGQLDPCARSAYERIIRYYWEPNAPSGRRVFYLVLTVFHETVQAVWAAQSLEEYIHTMEADESQWEDI